MKLKSARARSARVKNAPFQPNEISKFQTKNPVSMTARIFLYLENQPNVTLSANPAYALLGYLMIFFLIALARAGLHLKHWPKYRPGQFIYTISDGK